MFLEFTRKDHQALTACVVHVILDILSQQSQISGALVPLIPDSNHNDDKTKTESSLQRIGAFESGHHDSCLNSVKQTDYFHIEHKFPVFDSRPHGI